MISTITNYLQTVYNWSHSLTLYNGIFNVTKSSNKFYFTKTITDLDDYIQNTSPPGVYEIESLTNGIKRIIIDKGHHIENDYTFTIKPKFGTLGSIIETSPQGAMFNFVFIDSIRNLLGLHETILYKECNLSPNHVDILSFDNIFLERNIVQGRLYKSKRSGIIHKFKMDVDPGYEYIDKLRSRVQWYMMESKDIVSSICFKLKIGNNQLVCFNDQSITFRLSIKDIYIST